MFIKLNKVVDVDVDVMAAHLQNSSMCSQGVKSGQRVSCCGQNESWDCAERIE